MSDMQVTYQEMLSAASSLKSGRVEIDSQLARLLGVINQLVAEGFRTDKASPAFQAAYEEFNRGMKEAVQGLDGMGSYLTQAAHVIEETDSQLAAGAKA